MELKLSLVAVFIFVISLSRPCECARLSQKERLKKADVYFYNGHSRKEIPVSQLISRSRHLYDETRPVKILIHGWMGNRNHITIEPVKNAYLARQENNLLIVNWSSGARQNYDLSRALVPAVAKRVFKILRKFFQSFNIPVHSVHILGHSLGAHIAGNIGKAFGGQIGRITALDPAGPLFLKSSSDACSSRDAIFVDAIHTDVGVLGEFAPRGHIDFYPNRGFPPQPGCLMLDLITASSCSHYRAPLLYAESILIPDSFLSAECSRDELYHSIRECKPANNLNGRGPRKMALMGEFVSRNASGIFFLETNNSPPYGLGSYSNERSRLIS